MKWVPVLIISALATACSGSTQLGYPDDAVNAGTVMSIARLKSLCGDRIHAITTDITISGTVVANDWLGEFYKSIVVVDETGGIEISIDGRNLYREIPVFSRVTVFCNGMTLGRVGGKIELGDHPTGDFPVDALPPLLLSRYIRIDATEQPIEPVLRGVDEIGMRDISSYVLLKGVRIAGDRGNGKWCEQVDGNSITTLRRIEDRTGNGFAIRTDGRCLYAQDEMPVDEFDVMGIVDYSAGEYWLRIASQGYR